MLDTACRAIFSCPSQLTGAIEYLLMIGAMFALMDAAMAPSSMRSLPVRLSMTAAALMAAAAVFVVTNREIDMNGYRDIANLPEFHTEHGGKEAYVAQLLRSSRNKYLSWEDWQRLREVSRDPFYQRGATADEIANEKATARVMQLISANNAKAPVRQAGEGAPAH